MVIIPPNVKEANLLKTFTCFCLFSNARRNAALAANLNVEQRSTLLFLKGAVESVGVLKTFVRRHFASSGNAMSREFAADLFSGRQHETAKTPDEHDLIATLKEAVGFEIERAKAQPKKALAICVPPLSRAECRRWARLALPERAKRHRQSA